MKKHHIPWLVLLLFLLSFSACSRTKESPTPPLVGTLVVQDGDQLERDILPQLSTLFGHSLEEVRTQLAQVEEEGLIPQGLEGFRKMEGLIPPGEYPIGAGEELKDWIPRWIQGTKDRLNQIAFTLPDRNDLSPQEQLVLASIISAECLAGEYHKETAAVFLNRLEAGTKLQSCVTAEYAMGYQRPFLYGSDVAITDPYNTYQAEGLPPGPIGSFGDGSLQAAMAPSIQEDLWYFYYDYIQDEMHFFTDYVLFKEEANASMEVFKKTLTLDPRGLLNKQETFGKGPMK